jgi:hypothetical protein
MLNMIATARNNQPTLRIRPAAFVSVKPLGGRKYRTPNSLVRAAPNSHPERDTGGDPLEIKRPTDDAPDAFLRGVMLLGGPAGVLDQLFGGRLRGKAGHEYRDRIRLM